jgi:hypothetical protein
VWEPPEVFEWTWDVDVLRWELRADGDGTLLTLTTRLGEPSAEHPANTAAGYHVCLDQLIELLDTGSVGPLEDADVSELEQRYGEALSAE